MEAPKACRTSGLLFTVANEKSCHSVPGILCSVLRVRYSGMPRHLLSAFDVAYQCLRQHALPRFSPDRLPLSGPGRGSISRIAAHSPKSSGSDSKTTCPVDRAERPSLQLRGLFWESGLIHFASIQTFATEDFERITHSNDGAS